MGNPKPSQIGTALPIVRAQTLPLQGLVNVVIRGLLRALLLSRIVDKRFIAVYVVAANRGGTTRHRDDVGDVAWAHGDMGRHQGPP
jgi:hypothetical protein